MERMCVSLTRTDYRFIATALVLGLVGLLLFQNPWQNNSDLRAVILIDGEVYDVISLAANTDTIEIHTDRGRNTLSVFADGVAMIDADCPNLDCVHTGKITRVNQTIVCLPHRLLIRLESKNQTEDVDAVAK